MADIIKLYGATWCPDCRRAKQFFDEHDVAYEWIDITDNLEAVALVEELNDGNRSIPTILFEDGSVLVEPSNAELAAKTGRANVPTTNSAEPIKLYGATWCPDCRRAKQFFDENDVAYEWIDITDNEEAIALVEELNNGNRSIPTILFADGSVLVEPSNAELAAKTRKTDADPVKVYGATWCPDCRRAKQFFGEHRIPYEWIDITDNEEAIALVEELNDGNRSIPTILFADGSVLVEPSNAELAAKFDGLNGNQQGDSYHDVIIIGGGPAGLTSAIYTAREGLKTMVLEKSGMGGQVAVTQVLDNFPGFPEGISGAAFAERMTEQAQRFSVDLVYGAEIVDIVQDDQYIIVKSADGTNYIGRTVLLTTGSRYKRLNVPGEEELIGRNVHFCATCDGAFYQNKDVIVVGGGNSGFEEGLFLADQFAQSVRIVEFMPEVNASQIYQAKVADREDMSVFTNHAIREFLVEDGKFAGIAVEDRETGMVENWQADGVFVFIGLSPNTGFLPETIERDAWGFIKTDLTLQTSMKGVFAAGDVRAGSTKQAVAAAGEGATAALMMRQYLQMLGDVASINPIEREDLRVAEA